MGLGTPPQMIEMIARGVDMFDCVLPTRIARNGTAFTRHRCLSLKNAAFAEDPSPIEEGCRCYACRNFSRAYIRHLIKAEEILGLRLITLHNLHFYLDLMRLARAAILEGTFSRVSKGVCLQLSAERKSLGAAARCGQHSPRISLILAHVVVASLEPKLRRKLLIARIDPGDVATIGRPI